jgi:hypothetical protein
VSDLAHSAYAHANPQPDMPSPLTYSRSRSIAALRQLRALYIAARHAKRVGAASSFVAHYAPRVTEECAKLPLRTARKVRASFEALGVVFVP